MLCVWVALVLFLSSRVSAASHTNASCTLTLLARVGHALLPASARAR